MAILLFKVHVEELTFPYRRELVDTFPNLQLAEIVELVEKFNNARSHIWSFKLEYRHDPIVTIVEEHKPLPSF